MKSHLYNSIWSSSVPKSVKGSSDVVKVLRSIFLSESHVWSRWSRCQCFSASLRSRRDWSLSSWWSKYVFLVFISVRSFILRRGRRPAWGSHQTHSLLYFCANCSVAAQNHFMLIIVTSSTFLPYVCSLRHETFYVKTRP